MPDYSSWSDQDLQAYANKNYSAMSDAALDSLSNQQSMSPSFGQNLMHAANIAMQGASNPASLLPNILNVSGADPSIVAPALGEGAGRLYQNLYNLSTKIPGASSLGLTPSTHPLTLLPPSEENSLQAQIARGAGGLLGGAPLMAIPGAALPESAMAAAPILSTLGRIGLGGGINAAIGAASLPNSAGSGALLGGATGAIGEGVSALPAILRGVLAGTRTPEQIQDIKDAIPEGINLPIGDITNSPFAVKMYKTAQMFPFSGAEKPYLQLNDYLQNSAKTLAPSEAIERANGNPNAYVYNAMSNLYENAKQATNAAYENYSQLVKNYNVPFDRSQIDTYITPEIEKYSNLIGKNAEAKKLYGGILDTLNNFKNSSIDSFQDATDQMPVINDLLKSAGGGNDPLALRTAMGLKDAFNNALDANAQNVPELLDAYNAAKAARINQGQFERLNLGGEMTPFFKVYSKNGDPSTLISSYIKPSKGTNDFSGILQNFVNTAPADAVETAKATYLNPSNLGGMVNKINNFSPTQKSLLFGENQPLADQLVNIANVFKDSKNPAFSPETGYLGAHIGGTAAMVEGIVEGIKKMAKEGIGSGLGSIAGAAFGLPVAGQAIQRTLRSPALLSAVLGSGSGSRLAPYLAPALPAAIGATQPSGYQPSLSDLPTENNQ